MQAKSMIMPIKLRQIAFRRLHILHLIMKNKIIYLSLFKFIPPIQTKWAIVAIDISFIRMEFILQKDFFRNSCLLLL